MGVWAALALVGSAAWSMGAARLRTSGVGFYLLVWMGFPIFNVLTVALIYRDHPALRDYAVIGGAGMALLFGMQFNAAEILDDERRRGTLGNLFLSPAPRYVWLAGFQLFAICESLVTASFTVGVGAAAFGLQVSINALSLGVTLLLLLMCLWGFSMVIGSIGLAIREANQLSNLVFPVILVVAGTMYPVAALPAWAEVPARALPFGYAMAALTESVTGGASLSQLGADLGPLLGFACGLPLLGVAAFRTVERRTRRSGTLDLV